MINKGKGLPRAHIINLHSRLILMVYLGLALLPAIATYIQIDRYGNSFPFWDHWVTAAPLIKAHSSSLSFQDLFGQHNEHRMFFPRLILVLLSFIDGTWNFKYELIFSYLIVVGTFLLIVFLALSEDFSQMKIRKRLRQNQHILGFSLVISSLLIFSPIQHENFTWGIQLAWFLVNFLFVFAVYCTFRFIQGQNFLFYFLAQISCFIASFSSAHGLLSWFSIFPIFIFTNQLQVKQKIYFVVAWLGTATLSISLYFLDYEDVAHHPDKSFFFDRPVSFLRFYLSLTAKSLAQNSSVPLVVGTLLVLAYLFFLVTFKKQSRKIFEGCLPWLSIGLFSSTFMLAVTSSRLGFGEDFAASSRYSSISLLLPLSLIHLWRLSLSNKSFIAKSWFFNTYRGFTVFLIGLFVVVCFQGYKDGWHLSYMRSQQFIKGKACVELMGYLEPSFAQECIRNNVYPEVELVTQTYDMLVSAELIEPRPTLDFSAATNNSTQLTGLLEAPASAEITDQESIAFKGWALPFGSEDASQRDGVVLLRDEERGVFFEIGLLTHPRPDVVREFGVDRYLWSGWDIPVARDQLNAGFSRITAYLYDFRQREVRKLLGEASLLVKE